MGPWSYFAAPAGMGSAKLNVAPPSSWLRASSALAGPRGKRSLGRVERGQFAHKSVVALEESREVAAQFVDRLLQRLVQVYRLLERDTTLRLVRGLQNLQLLLAALRDQRVVLFDLCRALLAL